MCKSLLIIFIKQQLYLWFCDMRKGLGVWISLEGTVNGNESSDHVVMDWTYIGLSSCRAYFPNPPGLTLSYVCDVLMYLPDAFIQSDLGMRMQHPSIHHLYLQPCMVTGKVVLIFSGWKCKNAHNIKASNKLLTMKTVKGWWDYSLETKHWGKSTKRYSSRGREVQGLKGLWKPVLSFHHHKWIQSGSSSAWCRICSILPQIFSRHPCLFSLWLSDIQGACSRFFCVCFFVNHRRVRSEPFP